MKPKGTMVKAISGHYCVCEYRSVREGKRRRTKMGRCIGRITEAEGYLSNAGTKVANSELACVEFGQYAIALACLQGTLTLFRKHFARADADRIYACALIHFVEGFQRMVALARLYKMSVLSLQDARAEDGIRCALQARSSGAGPDRLMLGRGGHRRPRDRLALLHQLAYREGIQALKAQGSASQHAHGIRRAHRHAAAVAHV
ncbi:MAG: hypothetical protein DUD39_03535 [Coriobacteriaceae bacterium]|nr:MAG: hypothetical protein DUD39_03535 [Coriobacteriaceae bacterium]